MSAARQEDTEDGGLSIERERTVITLLTEMLMLPFTAFLHGMELLVRAVQGTQSATERGIHAIAEAPRTSASVAERGRNLEAPGTADDAQPAGTTAARSRGPR